MGLCKCPKKKVTNLFCFEHRVNVCEHCLVSNHPKCIVQSYLQWLQDSDYDPTCRLCSLPLVDEKQGDCVRLICYDVFHWWCIDRYARQLPANTAPAGYTCPACQSAIFPAPNVVSPVAEALRRSLTQVNWARAGLGMPLIDEPRPEETASTSNIPAEATTSSAGPSGDAAANNYNTAPSHNSHATPQQPTHTVVTVSEPTTYSRGAEKITADFNPRRLFDSTETSDLLNMTHDHDEDKYKRRPAMQWFFRWFQSVSGGKQKRKDPNAHVKRFAVVLILGLIAFFTVLLIFSRLGRQATDDDPFLDPMANPNIRVAGN